MRIHIASTKEVDFRGTPRTILNLARKGVKRGGKIMKKNLRAPFVGKHTRRGTGKRHFENKP